MAARALVVLTVSIAVGCGGVGAAGPRDVRGAPTTPAAPARELHLVLSADEHGWLAPLRDPGAGLARGGVLAFWDRVTRLEGFRPGPSARAAGWLLLSSGDMWTGPYESTVLEGAPMVEAMNHMGYAAAAVGNHDYDFGLAVAARHAKRSVFPYLAANVVERSTGALPTWVKPFIVLETGGMKVGVVGLSNVDSPVTTDPRNIEELEFLPYVGALEEWVPRARAAGAEQVIVLVHDGVAVADAIMPTLRRLGVSAAVFGHHHVASSAIDDNGTPAVDDDVVLCNPGPFLRSYCRIDLAFEGARVSHRQVVIRSVEQPLDTPLASADAALQSIVAQAEANAERVGGEVLTENVRHLQRGQLGPLGQFVVDSWIEAMPWVQVAITNAGGMRQDLPAGPIRLRDVVSVLPFNNNLLVVELTGAQLREALSNPEAVVAGVRFSYREDGDRRVVESVTDRSGKPVPDDARLKVLVHDFIYRGGDHFLFKSYDGEPQDTATDWREPVLLKLREMGRKRQTLDVVSDGRVARVPASLPVR